MTPQRGKNSFSLLILFSIFLSLGSYGCGGAQEASDASNSDLGRRQSECEAAFSPDEAASSILPETVLLNPGSSAEAQYWKPQGRLHPSRAGIIFVSGVDGGYIEPADGIYTRLAQQLALLGVPSIFVQYRQPGVLEPSVNDALASAKYLRELGVIRMAIAGWSFGGAVIAQAAVRIPEAVTIVGFAPQAKDTETVQEFKPTQSILLFHSYEDENVPFISSQQILDEAPEGIKKQLVELEASNHILDGEGEKLTPIVLKWLENELHLASAPSGSTNSEMGTEGTEEGMAHCYIPQT